MSGDPVAGRHVDVVEETSPRRSNTDNAGQFLTSSAAPKGVSKLLVGVAAAPKGPEPQPAKPTSTDPLPAWFLLAADILLLLLAIGIVMTGERPIGLARALAAGIFVTLGAGLALLAIWPKSS